MGSSATQPLAAHPCYPSQMCSGTRGLLWPGIQFTKIKEPLCSGQRASAGEEIKAALEVVWAWCGPGWWGNRPAGDTGGGYTS